jgi:cytochrome c peroxidase
MRNGKKFPKGAALAFITIAGIVGYYFASTGTQKSTKKVSATAPLSDSALKSTTQAMRLRHPDISRDSSEKLIDLGSKLFFDKGFSSNGEVACATCHQPEKSFTDGKPTGVGLAVGGMNTPTVINAYGGLWFFWNGRADSLEAQALGPVENPGEHGFSRGQVVKRIIERYKTPYEALFGPIPPEAIQSETLTARPAGNPARISHEVAAYALATLGSPILQKSILRDAQSKSLQPVEILEVMAAGSAEKPTAFDLLPDTRKTAINHMFRNFGRAIAAFERTVVTTDAPFDRFVDRFAATENPTEALGEGFGEPELRGLRIFTGRGNCVLCHQGGLFTDQQFHNIGLPPLKSDSIDLGRAQGMLIARDSEFGCLGVFAAQDRVRLAESESCLELKFIETESAEAVGAFKTPTLRNLRDTSPYGHDGRFPRLRDALNHYNNLGTINTVGHTEESLRPLGLTLGELDDLESFLMSLNSSVEFYKAR